MVSEESLYDFIGRQLFDEARQIKSRQHWTTEARDLEFKELLDRATKKLDRSLLSGGIMPTHIRAECLSSLKFHLMMNAGIEIPLDEFQRLLSPKNPDGTSQHIPSFNETERE